MSFLVKATKAATNRMPKMISPGAHAVIDYMTAGTFVFMGARFWNKNKKAAFASLMCGVAEIMTAAFTDYPGGVKKVLSFRTHGAIDVGLATLVSSVPSYMKFDDEDESTFFTMQAVGMAAVTGLTDFTGTGEPKQLDKIAA